MDCGQRTRHNALCLETATGVQKWSEMEPAQATPPSGAPGQSVVVYHAIMLLGPHRWHLGPAQLHLAINGMGLAPGRHLPMTEFGNTDRGVH
jgi:hypothetical protein